MLWHEAMIADDHDQAAVAPAGPSVVATVIDAAIRLAFLGLFAYLAFSLVAPFVAIAIWAIILTVAVYPIYTWLKARFGERSAPASLLLTAVGLIIVLGPAAALVISLFESMNSLFAGLSDGTLSVPPPWNGVRSWPVVGEQLYDVWNLASDNLEEALQQYGPALIPAGRSVLGGMLGVGGSVLGLAASVIIAGFLFKRGPAMAIGGGRFVTRLVGDRGAEFVDLAGATIRNVSRGVIGVSLLQSLLAGVGFMAAGIPEAGLLTLLVLLLGIIQIGPGILMIPTIIWVWANLDPLTALLFTLFMIPVTLLDNLLKPIVMGRGLRTPMLVIFIGVLGGTLAYGLIGLFLGPIVLAVFYELLVAWVKSDRPEAEADADSSREPAVRTSAGE